MQTKSFTDLNGTYTLETIQNQPTFKSIDNFNFGYQKHTVFTKTIITNHSDKHIHKIFYVPRSTIDIINIKIYKNETLLNTYHYGDYIPNDTKEHQGRYTHFDLILEPHSSYSIYLELKSSGIISTKLMMSDATSLRWRAGTIRAKRESIYILSFKK